MRRTHTWARRATAVLLSLAMAGGGVPPAALAEELNDSGGEIQLTQKDDEAAKDEDLAKDQQPDQNENQVAEGLEETLLDEVDPVEEENQDGDEDAQVPLDAGADAADPADDIQVVEEGGDDVDVIVQVDPALYAVTIADGIEHGSLDADASEAAEGETVTFATVPDAGYVLVSIAVTQTEGGESVATTPSPTPGNYTVEMPAAAITATATFAKAVATVTAADSTTTAYATPAAALDAWKDGCTLTLQADWFYSGSSLDYIHVDGYGDRTLDLNGHGINTNGRWNNAIEGGDDSGSLTIVDGDPDAEHRYTVNEGGLATVDDSLTEGYQTFRGGYVTGSRRAIYLEGGSLSMTGGTLIGNNSGAVLTTGGTLELDGTTITGNNSYGYASGMYLGSTDVTLNDVSVTGNVDEKDNYGAVYAYGSTTLAVSGSTTISGNFGSDGETPMNLFLDGPKLTVEGPLTGIIGVRRAKLGTFTSGLPGNGGLDNFVSEMGDAFCEMTLTDEGEAQFTILEGNLVIPSTGSDTYDMTGSSVDDSVTVYDEAGPSANYGSSWDGTLTIVPPVGKAIQVTGTVDTEYDYDYLYVYESSAEEDYLARVSGQGQTVDVTVTDDPLVLRFKSDSSIVYAGVALTVTIVDVPQDYAEKDQYSVTCSPAEHGTASADKTSTWEGKLVTITATPDEGYLPSGITVNGEPIQINPYSSTQTFTMPAEDVTVAATFGEAVTVTFLDADGTELKSGLVLLGDVAVAPEVEERAGAVLKGWAKDGTMFDLSEPIAEDTTLTAVWVEGQALRSDFTEGIPSGWTQDGNALWRTYDYSGNICLGHPYDRNTQSRLIMPAVDLTSPQSATLSFLYQNRADGSDIDQLGVDYRVGEDGEWKTIFQTTEAHGDWTEQTLDLISLIPEDDRTGEVYLAFHGYGNYGYRVYLDDVALDVGGHSWSYAADDEADVITATCDNGADVCTIDGAQTTITLSAEDTVYSGDPVEATVTVDDAWTTANGLVEPAYALDYYQGETKLDSAPTDVGDYTARLTLDVGGGAEVVEFEEVEVVPKSDGDTLTVSKDFSVTPASIDATVTGTTRTYDGSAYGISVTVNSPAGADVTYAEVQDGDYSATAPTYSDAGTHTVWYKIQKDNYTTESGSADVVINPKEVGLDWSNTTFTYDGKSHAPTATATGLVGTDECDVTVSGAQRAAGDHTATATELSNANYKLPEDATGAFTIAPKVVGLKWSGTKLTYNGKKRAPKAKATGLVSGDKCNVTVSGAAKDAGPHTATATALSNANYALPAKRTSKFSIARAKLTVTAKDKTIQFGDKAANDGVKYSGLKGSDTAKSLGGKLKYGYGGYKRGSKAGAYKITPSGLSSKNYKIAYKAGTLTVEAPATVGAKGQALADGKGWLKTADDGSFGTTGECRRVTGIKIELAQTPYDGGIQYRGAFQGTGWQDEWAADGEECSVKDKRLEAVRIRLTGQMAKNYDVWYRVHTQTLGWMAWTSNGAKAGTTGKSKRLEAVQMVILKKGSKAPAKDYNGIRQTCDEAFIGK